MSWRGGDAGIDPQAAAAAAVAAATAAVAAGAGAVGAAMVVEGRNWHMPRSVPHSLVRRLPDSSPPLTRVPAV